MPRGKRRRGGNDFFIQGNIKSKLILVLITLTGLSFLGLDRVYAGQTGLGVLKFLTIGGLGIWYLIDAISVIFNALSKSPQGLFGITGWSDDVNIAFNVTLGFIILQIIAGIVGLILSKRNKGSTNARQRLNPDNKTETPKKDEKK